MDDAYSPPAAQPAEAPIPVGSRRRSFVYWSLSSLAYVLLIAVWIAQISIVHWGSSSMSDAHAADDSEGGSFVWFLLGKAFQIGLLGWHAVPFALCSGGLLVRRREALLSSRLHATLLWGTVASFLVALTLILFF
jgi:uncharacterized protein YqgC (DUF456 family)